MEGKKWGRKNIPRHLHYLFTFYKPTMKELLTLRISVFVVVFVLLCFIFYFDLWGPPFHKTYQPTKKIL